MVRSLANPSSLSTQRSAISFFLDLEEVRGDMLLASDIVTIFSKSSTGLPSAVHSNLALFSYITYGTKQNIYGVLVRMKLRYFKMQLLPIDDVSM